MSAQHHRRRVTADSMRTAVATAIAFPLAAAWSGASHAGPDAYCVSCVEPARTYVCRVDTSKANPGLQALQFYCIVRTAKEGGHKSCSARRLASTACDGVAKTYVYSGPGLSPKGREIARKVIDRQARQAPPSPATEETEKEKPTTLLSVSSRAVKASRDGLRGTGHAIGDMTKKAGGSVTGAARKASSAVGSAARTAGSKVGNAARTAGSTIGDAARSAGSAVGSAARTAYGCVLSLFRECRSRSEESEQR